MYRFHQLFMYGLTLIHFLCFDKGQIRVIKSCSDLGGMIPSCLLWNIVWHRSWRVSCFLEFGYGGFLHRFGNPPLIPHTLENPLWCQILFLGSGVVALYLGPLIQVFQHEAWQKLYARQGDVMVVDVRTSLSREWCQYSLFKISRRIVRLNFLNLCSNLWIRPP